MNNVEQQDARGLMIRCATIQNFRCFRSLQLSEFRQVNIVVGDSGVGKTSLLEAIFMALAPITEVALRFRQHRGLDSIFSGSPAMFQDAIFGDLYFQRNMNNNIFVQLEGNDLDARSLLISRGDVQPALFIASNNAQQTSAQIPVVWTWKDSAGVERSVIPQLTPAGLQFGGTGEELPSFSYYASTSPPSSGENASRFSLLSRKRREQEFIDLLSSEYDWIESLSLEVSGGLAAIHATIKGLDEKVPMPNVSGSFNRITSILLSMAANPGGVVLVDEMDNGVYYQHQVGTWRLLLKFARHFKTQVITSTHSLEWLKALISAASDQNDDIALMRLERDGLERSMEIYSGEDLQDGLKFGVDVRASVDL